MKADRNDACDQVPMITGGHGSYLITGNSEYLLDLCSGTGCAGLGHSSAVVERILGLAAGMQGLPMNTYAYDTPWRKAAEDELSLVWPDYDFAFFSGGMECVEAAIRLCFSLRKDYMPAMLTFDGCF